MKVYVYLGSTDVWEPLERTREFLEPRQWNIQLQVREMAALLPMCQLWNIPPLPHASLESCMGLYVSRAQDHLEKLQVSLLCVSHQ